MRCIYDRCWRDADVTVPETGEDYCSGHVLVGLGRWPAQRYLELISDLTSPLSRNRVGVIGRDVGLPAVTGSALSFPLGDPVRPGLSLQDQDLHDRLAEAGWFEWTELVSAWLDDERIRS